jgi:hypothetical protein
VPGVPSDLTPPGLLRRLYAVYEVDNLNALASKLPRQLNWDAKKLYRWEKVETEELGDGPNFWHTIELLELAGLLKPEDEPSRLPARVRDLTQQLEAAADAIDQARETIRGLREPRRRAGAG